MTTDITSLLDQAREVQRRLAEQGAASDAEVVERLMRELSARPPQQERSYYTVTEAATLVGVSGQTIKNWVNRGILRGYRLGGRIVIPRRELDGYQALAEAAQGLDPTPDREEVIEVIRAGRKRFLWLIEPQGDAESAGSGK